MSRPALGSAAVLALLLAAAALRTLGPGADVRPPPVAGGDAAATYSCPMHPAYHSDRPGNCPICGMQLVPRGGGPGVHSTVEIPIERQQQAGVRFAVATRASAVVELRIPGRIAFDESQVAHVHTKVSGWIEDVFVDFVGAAVKPGQPLFSIYSPELVASQEEYLLALRASRELGQSSFERVASGSRALLESARRRLRLWDVTPAQIRALEERGAAARTLTVFSPVGGVVTERAVYAHGRYVTPELDLYTIANLERVWVVANVHESELPNVALGQSAEATLPYDSAHAPLRGEVSFVQPWLDPATRTAQVRFAFPNPERALRPESFVDVVLRRDLGEALVVPREAVLDTGELQYVFVDRGGGSLEPRRVRTGADVAAGRIVLAGLEAGERVVAAANFVVDAESRLQGALDALGRP